MPTPKQLTNGVLHAVVAVVKAEPVRVASWIVAALVGVGLQVTDAATLSADIGTVLAILAGAEAARTQVEPTE